MPVELRYYIAEPYWGRGIATESVKQICAYVFENTNITNIFATPYAFNEPSCRALEKAGFKFKSILHKNEIKNGKAVDTKLYEITKLEAQNEVI